MHGNITRTLIALAAHGVSLGRQAKPKGTDSPLRAIQLRVEDAGKHPLLSLAPPRMEVPATAVTEPKPRTSTGKGTLAKIHKCAP